MTDDELEQAARDAQHICAVCGKYVKSPDGADVDDAGRFGHERCLDVLEEAGATGGRR